MTNAHRQLLVSDLSPDQRVAYDAIRTWLSVGSSTKRTLSLGGYAGSGKSALVSVLAHEMPKPIAFCAFTGKASSVLGRKLAASGIPTVNRVVMRRDAMGERVPEPRPYCGTIHGLVYRPCDKCMVEETHEHTYAEGCRADLDEEEGDEGVKMEATDAAGNVIPAGGVALGLRPVPMVLTPTPAEVDVFGGPALGEKPTCPACDPPPPVKKVEGPCPRCNENRYLRRSELDRRYRLIVVDEASMVSDEMLDVLLSYNVPILAVGDHGQLPPVKGAGSLMRSPDLRLEKIHRQAEGNPIIALSARIRATGDIDDRLEDGCAFTILPRRDLQDWIAARWTKARLAADPATPEGALGSVLVSWTNRARVALNYDAREALGLSEVPPQIGEPMICLKNKAPIYNGMRGVLLANAVRAGDGGGRAPKWKVSVNFVEDGQLAKNVLISHHQIFAEKTIDYDQARELGVSMSSLGELYDMAYAMTCHKMQGSQAPEVGVLVEQGMMRMSMDDRVRWLYTAVTRAADRLTVIR